MIKEKRVILKRKEDEGIRMIKEKRR